jgi:hypothetical protein
LSIHLVQTVWRIGMTLAREPMRPLDLLAMACIPGGVYLLQGGRQSRPAPAPAQRSARAIAEALPEK